MGPCCLLHTDRTLWKFRFIAPDGDTRMILTDDLNTCFIGNRRSMCGFSSIKEISMARRHTKTMTTRIFENILFFLEEVFGDKDAAENSRRSNSRIGKKL